MGVLFSKLLDLKEGMVFDLGGRRLKILETPGHTSGGCSLIDEKERILFSGDVCFESILSGRERLADLEKGLQNLKAHEQEYDRNFCGHVAMIDSPWMVSVSESVLDDALHLCASIRDGSAKIEKGGHQEGMSPEIVRYGKTQMSLY